MDDYNTDDIVLAAVLRVLGHKLVHIEKLGNKGTFHFDFISEKVIQDYDCGKILVEPVSFNDAVKRLTTATRRTV